jgi:hypothetical protein
VRLPNNTLGVLVLIAAAFGFTAVWERRIGLTGLALALAAIAGLLLFRRFDTRGAAQRWLARASADPLVLTPPFRERWHVVAGGPDSRTNPYQHRSDRYFAYDFAPDDTTTDRAVLAPCDGMVVHVEDRHEPERNYIAIHASRGYVLLWNLARGSALVRVGEGVRAGAELARCDARLHVYAQNQPSASDVAQAVPIAFLDRGATKPLLLELGDGLG